MEQYQVRHGDVYLVAVNELPKDVKKKEGLVLAYGEVTGHKHQLDVGELFETRDGNLYLKLDKLGKLSHEEHKTITLPPGNYQVIHQREYFPEAIKRVAD